MIGSFTRIKYFQIDLVAIQKPTMNITGLNIAKKHRTNLLHKTCTRNSLELAILAYKSGEY